MNRIAILGSTGSIGTQALEVIENHSDLFEVELLTANDNWRQLAQQARKFQPSAVVIANPIHYQALSEELADQDIKVYATEQAIEQAVQSSNIDTVITALVGFSGLRPTISAIKAGKKVALANKETLVVGGELVIKLAREHKVPILPVDSEHSAIFQSIVGEVSPIERVILTASGGALRELSIEELSQVTPQQALHHPCWKMGAKITIDSATMMNKGFEVIEAQWLFGLKPEQIDVVIHPQSIIHSFVEFGDGAVKAQMGCPDMKLPIQYALTFPHRFPIVGNQRYNPAQVGELTFFEPDMQKYPCLSLAYDVMHTGGNAPCVMNAANEVAVAAFLAGEIGYMSIYRLIKDTLEAIPYQKITELEQLYQCDIESRAMAQSLKNRY